MANEYKPVTAQDAIVPLSASPVEADAAKAAKDAGVLDAAYVDYEKALKNYESRSDIETLEQRLARENGRTFDEAKQVRKVEEPVEGEVSAEENRDFKASQASETSKVSDGRETASLETIAQEQAEDDK